jgi:hypothetical protein
MSTPKIIVTVAKGMGPIYRVTMEEQGLFVCGFFADEKGDFQGDLGSPVCPWAEQPFKVRASVEIMAQMIIQQLEEIS